MSRRNPPHEPSAVKRCLAVMRLDTLKAEDGEWLGSEEDLLARYGVSRPTLRQAIGLLIQEQLVVGRRGARGGYFATRPTTQAVSHMAAIYLRMRNADLQDIVAVIAPLHEEIARLAAVNATEEERERVEAFITEQAELKADAPAFKDFLRAARAWETLLGEVCGNPVLALYLRILIDLVATLTPSQDIYIGRPARAKTFLEMRTRIALAIVEGDAELAALTTRRSSEATLLWMKEDLGSVADWQAAKLPAPVDS